MRKKFKDLSLLKPLIFSICLMNIAMFFRLLDIFVLRLDDILGEIILSKTIGFIIVILFANMISDEGVLNLIISPEDNYIQGNGGIYSKDSFSNTATQFINYIKIHYTNYEVVFNYPSTDYEAIN